ncbi:MAG: S41 family peptidase [Patescibacteria group bacterium]
MSLKFNLVKIRKVILGVSLFAVIFSGGYWFGVNGYKVSVEKALKVKIDRTTPPDKNADFSLFWRVWDTLGVKYFDKTKLVPSEMVYGAIQGMVAALGDPYTVFLKPSENKIVREDLNGSFEGVGIQIGFKVARLVVIAPLADSPAEKAGVKAGDYIIHIKDEAKEIDTGTSGIGLPDAVAAIRGKTGTKVTLTLAREGSEEPIIVEITRAKLDIPSVVLKFEDNVAILKVNKFAAETSDEWNKAVKEINDKCQMTNVKCGIVIDLRNNPGGYLQASVDLASDFIEIGKTVVVEERSDGTRNEFKVERLGRLMKYKVVVLVNDGSASASEILAGALRDQKGIKLVGVKTFGKGTIQEPIEINGGSGIHITTARWLTPNSIWVNEKGLEPDVKVDGDEKTETDEQLEEALKLFQ